MSHSCSLAHHEQMQNDYPKCHNDTVLVSLTKMFTCPSQWSHACPKSTDHNSCRLHAEASVAY